MSITLNTPATSPRMLAIRLIALGVQPWAVAQAVTIYQTMQCKERPVSVCVTR